MNTLLLWRDENGEARAAIVVHSEPINFSEATQYQQPLWRKLDNFNEDGVYISVSLPGNFRPELYNEYGNEILVQFVDM